MKVSTIKQLANGRVQLILDDGQAVSIERSVVSECGLYPDAELTEQELQNVFLANQRAAARARAVRITASTAISERELRRRLRQKGEDEQSADEAVDWLRDLGTVNDEALAQRLVQQAQAKGYGKARIRQILYQKGIPREYWQQAMQNLEPGDAAIDLYLQRHLNGQSPDRKQQQRVIDALRRRGFGWDEIHRGLERYGAELEETE